MANEEIFTSIEELPEDQWNGTDGDNSTLEHGVVEAPANLQPPVGATSPPKKLAPFRRKVRLGSRGLDVRAIKRALAVAGYGKWNDKPTLLFGPFAVKNLRSFQKANGLKPTGVYDLPTHRKLARHFDAYGVWLLLHYRGKRPTPPTSSTRQKIVATAIYGYLHRGSIHYTQTSLRMQGVRNHLHPPEYPNWEDCSSYATWCYYVAGAPDPNGLHYSGYGYTGTLANHGRSVSVAQMQPGDLVIYGHTFPYHHVAIYIGHGKVVSHGGESGPLIVPYNYRGDLRMIRSYM
jgi:cell wall-associated NlpC family hydrolase